MGDPRNQAGLDPCQGITPGNVWSACIGQLHTLHTLAAALGLTVESRARFKRLREVVEHTEELGWIGSREYADGHRRWSARAPMAPPAVCPGCGTVIT